MMDKSTISSMRLSHKCRQNEVQQLVNKKANISSTENWWKDFFYIRLYFCPSQIHIHIHSFTASQLRHSMTNSLYLTPFGFVLLTNRSKR